jgi:hypothetical protein
VAMAVGSPGAMNPCEVGGEHEMATKWKRQGGSSGCWPATIRVLKGIMRVSQATHVQEEEEGVNRASLSFG